MTIDLSNHIGHKCVTDCGDIATIEKNPDTYDVYAYRLVLDTGEFWSVTKDGYVWASKVHHPYNVKTILDETKPVSRPISPSKPKSKPAQKEKFFAYYNHDMEELQRTKELPMGTLITVISTDCSEKEFERYNIVYDAITK